MSGLVRVDPSLFEQPVLALARALVGKVLVRESAEGIAAGRIVETEAYRGPEDQAAHSANGRRTKRTEAMFGPPGHAYVFLLYGASWAFNVVAGPVDAPHAVLVRALEPLVGLDLMSTRRRMPATRRELTNGPGKLAKALAIDGRDYGADLRSGSIWIAEGTPSLVGRSPRIHIDYAGAWVERPWRFYARGNPWVSVRPRD